MAGSRYVWRRTLEFCEVYWVLVRIIVPVALATELLARVGAIEAAAPALAPLMAFYGLPPEIAFACLTGMLVGIWGAIAVLFTLVPISSLTVADMTVFSSLLLFAHALPIEQRIIQKAGPGLIVTTLLRLGGALLYAAVLHRLFQATGWLSEPLDPAWVPMSEGAEGWGGFLLSLGETLVWMFVVLMILAWLLELLQISGIMTRLNRSLSPFFRLAGIQGEAANFAVIGLFLGISYGAGLLIREVRDKSLDPRQVFVACVFMGFAHGMIEDTLVVVALGADFTSVFFGRLLFAIPATALVALALRRAPDRTFYGWMYARRAASTS